MVESPNEIKTKIKALAQSEMDFETGEVRLVPRKAIQSALWMVDYLSSTNDFFLPTKVYFDFETKEIVLNELCGCEQIRLDDKQWRRYNIQRMKRKELIEEGEIPWA